MYYALHACIARRQKHIERARDIDVIGQLRLLNRVLHPRLRRQMKHARHSFENGDKFFKVANINFMKHGFRMKPLTLAAQKNIHYVDFIASRDKLINHMRSDKSGSAGYDIFHKKWKMRL